MRTIATIVATAILGAELSCHAYAFTPTTRPTPRMGMASRASSGRRVASVRVATQTHTVMMAGPSFSKAPKYFQEPFERSPNFGDPANNYWGRDAFEAKYSYPPNDMNDGVYEVILRKPLGIVFEENVPGAAEGVRVVELVEGGNADLSGAIAPGDVLVGVTGIRVGDVKFERQMICAEDLDFDTVMSAIGSNIEKWSTNEYACNNVVMHLYRAP
mmetsp:Transcript_41634/g.96264  ORF Transcript_41634/g.96264 Transcript_41634/m.96264 type:complete len:215 (+) Transcript_41634:150-794(+)